MKNVFKKQFIESLKSILPIVGIVILICLVSQNSTLINLLPAFLIGSILLVFGISIFNIGADISMIEIGSKIGSHLTQKKSIPFLLILSFIIGYIITVAEPDLRVLASLVPSISSNVLVNTVSLGVAIFLLFSIVRMLFQIKFSIVLSILCFIAFALSFFTPNNFIPLAFDSGGVTTGPISVPFIIALGAGLSFTRHDKKKTEDTFGIISFCSIGPIIIVLLLGIIYNASGSYNTLIIPNYSDFLDVILSFLQEFPKNMYEVFLSVCPVTLFFFAYNILFLRLKKKEFLKICAGILLLFSGLSIFFVGVNVGFMPMGYMVGSFLSNHHFFIIPISMIFGYFIVLSEPAVGILTVQIENITKGNIKRELLNTVLSLSVAIATGLSILRIVFDINIMWLILPGYMFAVLMTPFVPEVFTAIAFDSGGVASGTMAASFLLPFAEGIAVALGRDILTDAFGLIAVIATVPLIAIQVVGLVYKVKTGRKVSYNDPVYNEEIIDY